MGRIKKKIKLISEEHKNFFHFVRWSCREAWRKRRVSRTNGLNNGNKKVSPNQKSDFGRK